MHWSGCADQRGLKNDAGSLDLIKRNDEDIFAGSRQREVEDEHGGSLEIDHAGGRFVDLHHSGLLQDNIPRWIVKPDSQFVGAKFGPPTAQMEHQVRPRMNRRELLHRDVPPDAEHGEFPLLIEERVIAEECQIDSRGQLTRIELTTSPCRIALTTSIPPVT